MLCECLCVCLCGRQYLLCVSLPDVLLYIIIYYILHTGSLCTVALCLYAYKSPNTLVPCVTIGTEHVAGLVAVLLSLFHRVLQENADRVGIIKSSGAPQKVFRNSPEI